MKKLLLLPLLFLFSTFSHAASFAEATASLSQAYYSNTFQVKCNDPNTKYLGFRVQVLNNPLRSDLITAVTAVKSVSGVTGLQKSITGIASPTAYRAGGPGSYLVIVTTNSTSGLETGQTDYKLQTWCVDSALAQTTSNPVIYNFNINSYN